MRRPFAGVVKSLPPAAQVSEIADRFANHATFRTGDNSQVEGRDYFRRINQIPFVDLAKLSLSIFDLRYDSVYADPGAVHFMYPYPTGTDAISLPLNAGTPVTRELRRLVLKGGFYFK